MSERAREIENIDVFITNLYLTTDPSIHSNCKLVDQ